MARLNIVVEGSTEEGFANDVLKPHLASLGPEGVYLAARRVETSRRAGRIFRGGLIDYARVKGDLLRWMKEDKNPEVFFTSMLDLYRLPEDFPGYEGAAPERDPAKKVVRLEASFAADLEHPRFIPYLQLHEFEALIFTRLDALLEQFPAATMQIMALETDKAAFESPEDIDDGEATAPSKRIIKRIPEYQGRKASVGPAVVKAIGLPAVRAACPHFNAWLTKLENLSRRSQVA